jgi:hypothetical protein
MELALPIGRYSEDMKPKKSRVILVIVVLVALVGGFFAINILKTVRLTAPEIQADLNHRFPFEKRQLILAAKFSEPTVSIDSATNRVKLGFSTNVSALGLKAVSGRTEGTGAVRYEPTSGEIFLVSPEVNVTGFELAGLPEQYRNPVGNLLAEALKEYLIKTPIYKLKDKDYMLFSLRRSLKSISVKDGALELEFGI